MSKIQYIIYSLAGVLLLTACNDLDQLPTNRYTEVNYWTSTERAELMLNMAYRQMYSADFMWSDEVLSDNMIEPRGTPATRQIRNGQANAATDLFANTWKDLYGTIKTCHIFLENVGTIPDMNTELRERMIDEIRFIRAHTFLRLSNFYGDIPFFTTDISLDESKVVARSPRSEVIKFINEELDDIIARKNLPVRDKLPAAENGRITLGAAVALQARVYLHENDWVNVQKYCSYLINNQSEYGTYSLFKTSDNKDNYLNLFTVENENNNEVILDCGYVAPNRGWNNMGSMGPRTMTRGICSRAPLQSLVDSYVKSDGKLPTGAEKDNYNNRDPRLYATVVYDGYEWVKADGSKVTIRTKRGTGTDDSWTGLNTDQSASGYYVRKYYDLTMGTDNNSGLNLIMFRYADILLMYAEARNEQSKLSQAEWNMTIRALRERAGFTDNSALVYPASSSQDDLREIIRNERRSELALEGLRYYDIKRWKAGTKYLDGTTYGAKIDDSGQNIQLDDRRFNESRDYLWSLPLSQMDLNPNLKPNNPGYGS